MLSTESWTWELRLWCAKRGWIRCTGLRPEGGSGGLLKPGRGCLRPGARGLSKCGRKTAALCRCTFGEWTCRRCERTRGCGTLRSWRGRIWGRDCRCSRCNHRLGWRSRERGSSLSRCRGGEGPWSLNTDFDEGARRWRWRGERCWSGSCRCCTSSRLWRRG